MLLGLLAFVLTALAVYGWGSWDQTGATPKPTYTATAYIVERQNRATTDELRIPMAYTGEDPRRAEDVANVLAESYVADRREQWKRRTQRPREKAREAAETAQNELAQAEASLEAFRQQITAKPPAAAAGREEAISPPVIENPEWIDLSRQLGELDRRRDALLVDRTPLHPAVQEVAVQIEGLKREMVFIPRQIAGKLPSPTWKGSGGEGDPIANQDHIHLNELTAMVETARQSCQRAEAAEKRAVAEQQAGPWYSVVYAQTVEVPPAPDGTWLRLVWTALVAGTLMACGVGSVSTGANIDPPVGSVTQVQTDSGALVVGTMPASDPIPNAEMLSRRQSRIRRGLVAAGLLLMAASPTVAVLGVVGI